jgi:hypothetical protein
MLDFRRTMGKVGEWFWRFLAVVMVAAVAWMLWIFHQLNPTPLATAAAFEAAAKAGARQNAQGVIAPPPAASAPAEAPQAMAKEPPVDMEKLKFTDSIAVPAK